MEEQNALFFVHTNANTSMYYLRNEISQGNHAKDSFVQSGDRPLELPPYTSTRIYLKNVFNFQYTSGLGQGQRGFTFQAQPAAATTTGCTDLPEGVVLK